MMRMLLKSLKYGIIEVMLMNSRTEKNPKRRVEKVSELRELVNVQYDENGVGTPTYAIDESKVLTGKELNALLPQVFTRDGKIRKDTRRSFRGLADTITAIKLAERCRNEDEARTLGIIQIQLPAGHIGLCDELADHIRATDLFVALATKGWYISSK